MGEGVACLPQCCVQRSGEARPESPNHLPPQPFAHLVQPWHLPSHLPFHVISKHQLLVISDEVYEYMVYEGLGARGEHHVANNIGPEAAVAAPQAAKNSTSPAAGGGDGGGGGITQPQSGGGSSAARKAPPAEVAKKAEVGGAIESLQALRHFHFATLPGMWDRTITISSAGKTFSVTGWQVRQGIKSSGENLFARFCGALCGWGGVRGSSFGGACLGGFRLDVSARSCGVLDLDDYELL